jgi:hypothetical protein
MTDSALLPCAASRSDASVVLAPSLAKVNRRFALKSIQILNISVQQLTDLNRRAWRLRNYQCGR